jgi:small conductance mechanosensitive channel
MDTLRLLATLQETTAPAGTEKAVEKAAEATPMALPDAGKVAGEIMKDPAAAISGYTQKLIDFAMDKGPGILAALAILAAGWVVSGWVRRIVARACEKAKIEVTLSKFFGNLVRWGILVFAVITSMGTLGINTTSLAAIFGAAGLAIGLALQGNLGNLASGVLLLIFRPFKVGDSVVVAGQAGTVDAIELFTTNLDTVDNRRIVIPNGTIFGGVIENQTHHPKRCITVNIPISSTADLDQADRIMTSAAERVAKSADGAFSDPPPNCVMADITPTVIWSVTVWAQPAKFASVRQALLREIKLELDKAGLAPQPPVYQIVMNNSQTSS